MVLYKDHVKNQCKVGNMTLCGAIDRLISEFIFGRHLSHPVDPWLTAVFYDSLCQRLLVTLGIFDTGSARVPGFSG